MNKKEVFAKELSYILDKNIREFTGDIVEKLPDYFFEVPASSTGKYHPAYTICNSGLVKHVKAAVRIAVELFRMNDIFGDGEKDCIISALILHDGLKSGLNKSTYTVHDHPELMAQFVINNRVHINDSELEIISNAIASHMGRWTTNKYNSVVLREPKSKIDKFVHMCDYLASRKCLEFNFDVEVER